MSGGVLNIELVSVKSPALSGIDPAVGYCSKQFPGILYPDWRAPPVPFS